MDFSLSDEQRLLIDTVRKFIAEQLAPLEDEVERTGTIEPAVARSIFEKSKALGLYGMNMPTSLGGGGLSAVDSMLVEEQFGHTTDILIRRAFGNVYEVLLACEGAQKERWLLPAVQGERICCIAITEPGAGSDAAGITTRAVPRRSGMAPDRPEALHQRRGVLRLLRRLGQDRQQPRLLAVPGRQGPARHHGRPRPADDGHPRHQPRRAGLRRRQARWRVPCSAARATA